MLDFDVLIGCNLFRDFELFTVTDHSGTHVLRKLVPAVRRAFEGRTSQVYDVPSVYADDVIALLNAYSELITSGYNVPAIKTANLTIRLIDNHIVNRPAPCLALTERIAVREIVTSLLEHEINRESESPYASPILLVKKKDGNYMMCVDYRELNSHTIKDRYPLPLIDDQLDRLGKGKFFTSLDLASGFYQISISDESIEKTSFITPDGHYDYLRMPFGLANAPVVFQRALLNALGALKDSIAVVYLDDILISSATVEEGLEFLQLILEALKVAGFSLNILL
jgi:hypothetical protein